MARGDAGLADGSALGPVRRVRRCVRKAFASVRSEGGSVGSHRGSARNRSMRSRRRVHGPGRDVRAGRWRGGVSEPGMRGLGAPGDSVIDLWAPLANSSAQPTNFSFLVTDLWSNLGSRCVYARATHRNSFYRSAGALYVSRSGTTWTSWGNGGTSIVSDPGSTSWGAYRVDTFVRDANNAIAHVYSVQCEKGGAANGAAPPARPDANS